MAHFPLRAMVLMAALMLVAGGAWIVHGTVPSASSITVKLPPARPATPHPGFAFEDSQTR